MTEHEKLHELLRTKDQAPVVIDTEKSALVVVDVQRFFARPEYQFGQFFEKLVPGVTTEHFSTGERYRNPLHPTTARVVSGKEVADFLFRCRLPWARRHRPAAVDA